MNISLNWLKEYIDVTESVEELSDALTLLGFEVDGIESLGSNLQGVVIGKVKQCVQHPNADRLKLCHVDIGESTLQIVCGAPNVCAGQTVPVAKVGTTLPVTLPNGSLLKIKKSKLRGERSEGMICAEDELGLGNNHEGIMVLDENLPVGSAFADHVDLYSDTVYEIALTPNRPDGASHIGIARDLAAKFQRPLRKPKVTLALKQVVKTSSLTIDIRHPEKCPRYSAIVIRDIKVGESPAWLKNRLTAIGLRPINNVVDATNYVLHETGQPLHAFDLNQISTGIIGVTSFDKDVEFVTLDSMKRKVPAGSLFICDDNTPIALAGIMGGENSEITEQSTDVLLETAYFEPTGIRKTAKHLGISTDASYRFERGVDPNNVGEVALRCAQLIADLADATVDNAFIDAYPIPIQRKKIQLRPDRIKQILGIEFSAHSIQSMLEPLEISIEILENGTLSCLAPTFRPDLEREIDLIEEVARLYDYNNIPAPKMASFFFPEALPPDEKLLNRIRNLLVGLSYHEMHTNSLLPESIKANSDSDHFVDTLNPISKEQAVLRSTLKYGGLRSLAYNLNRGQNSLRMFEVGHVFEFSDKPQLVDNIRERRVLGMFLSGIKMKATWNQPQTAFQFTDLKSDVFGLLNSLLGQKAWSIESIGHGLSLSYGKKSLGFLEQISPVEAKQWELDTPIFYAEIDLEPIIGRAKMPHDVVSRTIPRYPSVDFELALVMESSLPADKVSSLIEKVSGQRLKAITLLDVYEGETLGKDKKSLAFELTFQDGDKTLTLGDVQPIIDRIVNQAENHFGAKLRS